MAETGKGESAAPTVPKSARTRSPNYPGIGLRAAVSRANTLYGRDRRNWTHVDTALSHWDFKPRSGAGLVVIGALKAFGLLEDQGSGSSRQVRLTEFAVRLLLLDPNEHAAQRTA